MPLSKVEATLDKGIQTVYRLKTDSDKWIETTSEHPYLIRNTKLFVESNVQKQEDNKNKGKSYLGSNINISKFIGKFLVHTTSIDPLILIANRNGLLTSK